MKSGLLWTLSWVVLFAFVFIVPVHQAAAGNCVLYARAQTGVSLFGNAGGWWDQAAGLYQRGHVPEVGSILVFRRTGIIPAGHVAVVSKVIGPGQILVDQSNWYHGRVTRDTPVIDTSPTHDWTQVAVMNIGSGEFGRDSPTYGFVYPETGSVQAVTAGGFDRSMVSRVAYDAGAHENLFHFAIGQANWQSHIRYNRSVARARVGTRESRRRFRKAKAGRVTQRWVPHAAAAHARQSADVAHRSAVHKNPTQVPPHSPSRTARQGRGHAA
jgi:surface antigen